MIHSWLHSCLRERRRSAALLNFSSSQSFAPLVRGAKETGSLRLHDLQITSSHQCTHDARASFEVGRRTKLCPCTSLQQQNFLLSHHGFLPIISSSLASFRDEGPFNSSQLTGEEKPSVSDGNEAAPTMLQEEKVARDGNPAEHPPGVEL